MPGVEIVGQAANGFEAVKLAEELNPDLMFLDIQMPKLSGFEVLELLGERAPAVIFTHCVRRVRAARVRGACGRLSAEAGRAGAARRRRRACGGARCATRRRAPSAHDLAVSARPPGRTLERILIRHEGRVHVLPLERIDFIEAQDDYLSFSCRRQAAAQAADDERPGNASSTRRASCASIARSFSNVERLARIDLYGKDSWLAILSRRHQVADVAHGPCEVEGVDWLGVELPMTESTVPFRRVPVQRRHAAGEDQGDHSRGQHPPRRSSRTRTAACWSTFR